MGKLELVHLLLAAGADPALANESGETPLSVGASDEIKDAIRSFDPVETGRLVEEFATRAAARKAEARAAATAEESKLEDALGAAERADGVAQRELKAARAELARLIEEHDLLQTEGKGERTAEITLQAIHDAEARVEEITSRAAETAEAKAAAARALEEERARMLGEDLPADGDGDDDGDDTLRVEIGKLNDLLLRDTQGLLKAAAPRWPLLIDPSGQSTVFLTYADTNFVQVCNPSATEPNKLRRGLLGAIRYGKPLVLDCMDVDMRDEIEAAFGRVEPGLFARLLDRSLLEGEAFLSLVHAADGDEYKAINFDPRRVDRFQLIVITRMRRPSDKMLDGMLPVRVAIGP